MAKEKSFSQPVKCGHCHNSGPMEIVGGHNGLQQYEDGDMEWEAGTIYELLKCPACRGVTLRSYLWHSGYMDGSDVEFTTLYPSPERSVRGLPTKIKNAYEAAQKVRNIDANAYGVLLGRLLEFVCDDRSAAGGTLDQKLKSLAEKGEIPDKLVNVAAGLRKLRNIGAHAGLGDLTEQELPVLSDLTHAILDYVYSAPQLANEAEERLARLKRKTRKGSSKKASRKTT